MKVAGNLIVDSDSSSALTTGGSTSVTSAGPIQIAGGYQKGNGTTISPKPVTGVTAVPDPLGGVSGPDPTGMRIYGAENVGGSANVTIQPGIYTGITVSNSATLTMASGIYIIEGGGLSVSGSASIVTKGGGVLIVNAGSKYPTIGGSQTYGGITLSNSGSIKLSPYTNSGPYANLVIFQTGDNTQAMTFSGSAMGAIGGTIYAPSAALTVSNSAMIRGGLIVNRLTLSGAGVAKPAASGGGSVTTAAPVAALTASGMGALSAAAPSGSRAGQPAGVASTAIPISLAASSRSVAMGPVDGPDGPDTSLFEDSELLTDVAVSLIAAGGDGIAESATARSKART